MTEKEIFMERKSADWNARVVIYDFGEECEVNYFDDDFSSSYTPLTEDEERYATAEEHKQWYLDRGFTELHLTEEEREEFIKSIEDAFMR